MKTIKVLSLILMVSTLSMDAFSAVENKSTETEKASQKKLNMDNEIQKKEQIAEELADEIVEKMETRRALFKNRGDKAF